MRVLLYQHTNRGEQELTSALSRGIARVGDEWKILSKHGFDPKDLEGWDAVFTGRLVTSDYVMAACADQGINFVYFDKGYFYRGWKTEDPGVYYRFSVNSFQPLVYFQSVPRSADRWKKLDIELKPRKKNGSKIVITGCSQKFARMHSFTNESFTEELVVKLKKLTDRDIVYRPKSADTHAVPIPGTIFSYDRCKIEEELEDAHAVVTFSSNAAVDAVLAGVPAFVLGPGIAKPVSNTDLSKIEEPWFPTDKERLQWCYDLAYCQWRVEEMEDGSLWTDLKKILSRPEVQMSKRQTLRSVIERSSGPDHS